MDITYLTGPCKGETKTKSDFLGKILVKKGYAKKATEKTTVIEEVKELKDEMETKELKSKGVSKKRKTKKK